MGQAARSIEPVDGFRTELGSPRMVELYDYWHSLRRGRSVPARADIDPTSIPHHLPNVMLINVLHDPLRFRYRLIGTRVVDATGEDRTGRPFDEVAFFTRHRVVIEQYRAVVETRQPLRSLEPFTDHEKGTSYEVERLLLPLSSDGEQVDMMLVYFEFQSGPYSESCRRPTAAQLTIWPPKDSARTRSLIVRQDAAP